MDTRTINTNKIVYNCYTLITVMALTLLQWNCRSINSNFGEFSVYLQRLQTKPDVIMLQESWLASQHILSLPGYRVYRQDRPLDPHGGCATLVRNSIPSYEFTNRTIDYLNKRTKLELQVTVLPLQSHTISLINIYNPFTKLSDHKNDLINVISSVPGLASVHGDFNSDHNVWGSRTNCPDGITLIDIIDTLDLVVLNNGSGTRLNPITGELTPLDLTFVHKTLYARSQWSVDLDNACGSDHFMVFTNLMLRNPINLPNQNPQTNTNNSESRPTKWNTNLADWDAFREYLSQISEQDLYNDDINVFEENICNAIREAANLSIPPLPNRPPAKLAVPWWNKQCTKAVKDFKKARNRFRHLPTEENRAHLKTVRNAKVEIIKLAKSDHWKQYCARLNKYTPITKIWKQIKCMRNSNKDSSTPTLMVQGAPITSDKEKAEQFALTFISNSSDLNLDPKFRNHKSHVEQNLPPLDLTSDNGPLNCPFTLAELKSSFVKSDTAPGNDGITYTLIHHCPDQFLLIILKLFNVSWSSGRLPQSWKHSIVIPIPKPNKPPTDPNSYRPISLSVHIGKTMERMVNNRLSWHLEKHNIISKFQSGFRANRRTTDNLTQLQNDICKDPKASTVAVMIDMEKAFDLVWRKGIIIKMQKINICGLILGWLNNFLSNRSIQVRVNTSLSNRYFIQNGTPQGSIVSPNLFSIMINDLSNSISKTKLSLFADDIAIWKSSSNTNFAIKCVQSSLNSISNWGSTWGFKFSPSKTNAIIFTKKQNVNPTQLKIYAQPIEYVENVKFLGLTFNHTVTWQPHVDNVVSRCQNILNLMRSASGNAWGADKHTLLLIYRSLILSRISYGQEVFASASSCVLSKLDTIQCKALRIACGAMCSTPLNCLQILCNELPLDIHRSRAIFSYSLALKASSNNAAASNLTLTWHSAYRFDDTNVNLPFSLKVHRVLASVGYRDESIQSSCVGNYPPWLLSSVNVSTDIHQRLANEVHPDEPNRLLVANATIREKWQHYLHVFTDAAVSTVTNRVSAGFHIPYLKIHKTYRLTDNVDIDSAEATAILLALQFLETSRMQRIVIFTDSLHTLNKLNQYGYTSKNKISNELKVCLHSLKTIQKDVHLEWIPSHCGIPDHDYIDKKVKDSLRKDTVDTDVAAHRQQIYNIYKCAFDQQWQVKWDVGATGRRMHVHVPEIATSKFLSNLKFPTRTSATIYNRLITHHVKLNSHLHRLNLSDTPNCLTCHTPETIEHFLLQCNKHTLHRNRLFTSIRKVNPTLNDIFNPNSAVVEAVVAYVKATGVDV